jgi:pimeloyl-ACP methyl ester carboxylesterase
MKTKVSFKFAHGNIDGIYMNAGSVGGPLIIITNGHNGFYNYGMFPYIQETLFRNGISSYSYNFSHGGVAGDSDYFTELELYAKNCMRLETQDLVEILRTLSKPPISLNRDSRLYLFAHSLGGIPTIFAAKKAFEEGITIDGIALVSTVKTLNVWSPEMLQEWEGDGVYYLPNKRTNQKLPQGHEFLTEIQKADTEWNAREALRGVKTDYLIVHGEKDESVPVDHSKAIFDSVRNLGYNATLRIIEGATHTFNTKHPFEKTSPQLDSMLREVVGWISNRK